jgi:predicted transcriptional regulator of viral defense system
MKKTIPLNEALKLILLDQHNKPVVNLYELTMYMYKLYSTKEFRGFAIGKISAQEPDFRVVNRNIEELIAKNVIVQHLGLPVYFIRSKPQPTAQQFICSVNPFSYIAYLSAMEWHGITDRIPHTFHVVTCLPFVDKTYKKKKIHQDLGNLNDLYQLMVPRVTKIPPFDNKRIQLHQIKNYHQPREISDSGGVRVSSLGDTFLDMMRKPELCGGFNHVMDIYQDLAEEHLAIIVKTVDKKGTGIDKARVGYVLEERCGLKHKVIDSWKSTVQRGGSRKLIPENDYINVYSDTWCISIND